MNARPASHNRHVVPNAHYRDHLTPLISEVPLWPAGVRRLREALHHAVRWQLLVVNPADAVTPPRPQRKEMSVLDAEQASSLLDAAQDTEFEIPLVTALHTGLRVGELLGVRWRDVDLARGELRVQQAAQPLKGGGGAFAQPKTHRSRRAVSLPGPVVAALQVHKTVQTKARLAAGPSWRDMDLVFTDPLGGPVSRTPLRLAFNRLLEAADLPRIRLHDLDRTAAPALRHGC